MADTTANYAAPMGMSRAVQKNIDSKRSESLEADCRNFISQLTGKEVPGERYDALKDGVLLCEALNAIVPGTVKKIEDPKKNPFAKRANIESFINGCGQKLGIKGQETFQVNDLFENKNIPQVTVGIMALGRYAQTVEGYTGPVLGPKQAEENIREFTQEQMEAGKHITGLQMGSNKGASQAGQGFGRPRQVMMDGK